MLSSTTESVVLAVMKIQRKLSFRSIQIPLASISVIASDDQSIVPERQWFNRSDSDVPNKV